MKAAELSILAIQYLLAEREGMQLDLLLILHNDNMQRIVLKLL